MPREQQAHTPWQRAIRPRNDNRSPEGERRRGVGDRGTSSERDGDSDSQAGKGERSMEAPHHADRGNTKLIIPDKPKRILIADDEHLMASGIARAVASLGYQVLGPVSDGRAAIHAAETELPDMCLLDIEMPEMDGLQAANEIWGNMGIPAILISAYSQQEYIDRATETGVFAYLIKPVNADDLRVAIGIAWTRVKQQDVLAGRIRQLEITIDNRKAIEKAKWILVETNGFDEATAHASLQRHARTNQLKLHEVATAIVDGDLDPSIIQPRKPHVG